MYDALSRNADVCRDNIMKADRYSLVRIGYATDRGFSVRVTPLPVNTGKDWVGTMTDFGIVVSVEKLGVK